MAINFRSNTIIKNLRVGPLSGGGNGGGGGGSSEPTYLAVGAQGVGTNHGAIYVYDINDYSATPTKLAPSDLFAQNYFGNSVAATSDYIAVGAYGVGSVEGAIYVYDATNLSATPTKLAPSDLPANGTFSKDSIAATSNHIVVGNSKDNDQGSQAGAIYVYDATNLSATPTKLAPTGLDAGDYFGYSVAANSNYIVVGAFFDDDQGSNAGAVYVYDANNLSATPTKLAPAGIGDGDVFGSSVAVTSNHIVVGAYTDGDQGYTAGAVYVFDATNLSATPTKLAPSSLDSSDYFGYTVAANSNYIVVGAYGVEDLGSQSGAAYVYDATNLSATPTKLLPTGLSNPFNANFGKTISVAGDQIIIGAEKTYLSGAGKGNNVGSVYVFDGTDLSASPTLLTAFDGLAQDIFGSGVSLG